MPSVDKIPLFITQCLADGSVVFEWKHQRPDGEVWDAEVHLMSFASDHRSLLQFTLIDITERKKAETALRVSETQYRELWDTTVEGIVIHDQGKILEVNDAMCRMFGTTREQLSGKSLFDMAPAETHDSLRQHIVSGSDARFETYAMRADGTRLILEVFGKKIHYRGKLVRMAATRDITEQRRLESLARRTQRLESLGTLAGGIAHDLNNVLTPIMMSLTILNQHVTDPTLKKHIASIESSAHRGSDIVGQVLLFARGSEKEFAQQNLRYLASEVTSIIQQTFPRNIELSFGIPKDLSPIRGDATQIHQVLMNLCVNARDAMPNGGKLTITASNINMGDADAMHRFGGPRGQYVMLGIADTGTGIPEEIRERIFEPFFTTKEIGKGTGLGLSTVYAIMKDHKGFVALDSSADEGSSFAIYFPADQPKSEIEHKTEHAAAPLGRGETILVIDDEQAVLEITREILEMGGYRVLSANNGAEALSTFVSAQENSIHLVLTDVNMPGMDGPTVVATIRKLAPSMKAIIVSGLVSDWEPMNKTGVHIEGYLMKPYTSERLLATIHEVLTRE